MHHASACNVIERIFGVLKRRFRILQLPPEYDMSIQALIPAALAALHNFIRQYDPDDIQMYDDNDNDNDDESLDFQMRLRPVGELGIGRVTARETARANERRDRIAREMWAQYQHYLESHATRDE